MDVREQLQRILIETVTTLCKNTLDYDSELCVEGLLGITMDKNDVLLVNMKEIVSRQLENQKPEMENTSRKKGERDGGAVGVKDGGRKRKMSTSPNPAVNEADIGDGQVRPAPRSPHKSLDKDEDVAELLWMSKQIKQEAPDMGCSSENVAPAHVSICSNANVTVEPVYSISQSQCTAEFVEMNDIGGVMCEMKPNIHVDPHLEQLNLSQFHARHRAQDHRDSEPMKMMPRGSSSSRCIIVMPTQTHSQPTPSTNETNSLFNSNGPSHLLPSQAVHNLTESPKRHLELSPPISDTNTENVNNNDGLSKFRNRRVPVFTSLNYAGPKAYTPLKDKEGRYACHICGQTFQHNPSLHRHIRSHAGRYVPCPVCTTSFSRADSLRRHIKQTHPEYVLAQNSTGVEGVFCDQDSSFDGPLTIDESKNVTSEVGENIE